MLFCDISWLLIKDHAAIPLIFIKNIVWSSRRSCRADLDKCDLVVTDVGLVEPEKSVLTEKLKNFSYLLKYWPVNAKKI